MSRCSVVVDVELGGVEWGGGGVMEGWDGGGGAGTQLL